LFFFLLSGLYGEVLISYGRNVIFLALAKG
ncbi:EscS/YscS/HrcS family type III secretion system export apparatus protein, partial [Salmonella enterica subsp. enterica serovar Infantis]